ncbi:hypothetical protein HWV62_10719 [Athelia sp. TMB]|nr:hypothetical protein HWV62_10719 [Athelia sp. TMB]
MSTLNTKRKREEDEEFVAITRSGLWLPDGNVIVQAEGTQYKVHQSILSIHSSVFDDMFSIPQPSGGPLVEECPIVNLSDTAADVTIVLDAIYRRRYAAPSEALPISVVAAFLRLGRKYDIETLRADALKRLFYEIPSDFDSFQARKTSSMIFDTDKPCGEIDMLNLVKEQNLLSALPLARYRCCRSLTPENLFKPCRSGDGTDRILDAQEAIACTAAYVPLMRLQAETALSWILAPPSKFSGCQSTAVCSAARKDLAVTIFVPVANLCALNLP